MNENPVVRKITPLTIWKLAGLTLVTSSVPDDWMTVMELAAKFDSEAMKDATDVSVSELASYLGCAYS